MLYQRCYINKVELSSPVIRLLVFNTSFCDHSAMDKPPAQNFCKSDGGNLASVHSEEEHVFLRDYIRKVTGENKKTWMGGFDSVQEGEWMWSDGSTFDYKHWGSGAA
uniref:C-type lectin domain-containing protein n=1 Tax=Sander lucioperca TaxID=283035 RepID=A0A8C9Z882_SANLU